MLVDIALCSGQAQPAALCGLAGVQAKQPAEKMPPGCYSQHLSANCASECCTGQHQGSPQWA